MNKLVKLGLAALFAFSLAACNEKADPKADYAKLVDWTQTNESTQAAFQAEYQQKLLSRDLVQVKEAMDSLVERNTKSIDSLKAIKISDPEVKKLQEKTIEVLGISSDLTKSAVALMNNPNDQKIIEEVQAKTQQAQVQTAELQKMQAELAAKYGADAK
ncbi:hypothetical protein [Avibacterium avium]|uniref:hypothetical protein n=1 Tax=Avibacterium TaxID=292486 RepID=UPI003BF8776C